MGPINKTVLYQNYPNPFSISTTISFLATDLNRFSPLDSKHLTGQAQIKIYNIKGQLVRILTPMTNDQCQMTNVVWDGKDYSGKLVSNGIYFYQLESKNYKSEIKKMILLR
ncbi:MAG: T9SS type A sorting domain-containing protein [Candidatus Cloacimonetes bacterium]|nr:T9SS type A sorting domain-containing protein [Candidatus Cloacimonadota bacterium]